MKNIEVAESKTAIFECEVSHVNMPFAWLKADMEIEPSEKYGIGVQDKVYQLKIMNISHEDAGEYTFFYGEDCLVSATLTVTRKSSCLCWTTISLARLSEFSMILLRCTYYTTLN